MTIITPAADYLHTNYQYHFTDLGSILQNGKRICIKKVSY